MRTQPLKAASCGKLCVQLAEASRPDGVRRSDLRCGAARVHTTEGPDDMPAHIKAALTAVSLSIPVTDGRPALGTWQGIYLFEHRDRGHTRRVVGQLSG